MATTKAKATFTINSTVMLELSVDEAKALNEMTKYGIKAFLEGYKKCLGRHYIEPHEAGLTSLFNTIDTSLPETLTKLAELERTVDDAKRKLKS